jgi:hypothetical protein
MAYGNIESGFGSSIDFDRITGYPERIYDGNGL